MPTTDDRGTDQLQVHIERSEGTCVVRLAGELDLAVTDEARAAILQAENRDDAAIVIDIDGLRFIDSAGLALLLEVSRRNDGSGRVRMTQGNGHVARMLQLTGLDQALPLADGAGRQADAGA